MKKTIFLLTITAISVFAFGPTPCVCVETSSPSESVAYGSEMSQKFLDKIAPQMLILNTKLRLYNKALEHNAKTQRKWTSLMMAELAEKKKKVFDLRKERYLRCRNVDADILILRSKIEQLQVLLEHVKEKMNIKISQELQKKMEEINYLR